MPAWRYSERDAEIIRELAAVGTRAALIGEAVGSTKNAIIGYCRRNGIELKYKPPKKEKPPKKPKPPKKEKAPPTILAEPSRPPVCEPVTFAELRPHHCRFPIGEKPFRYCGADNGGKHSYCAWHYGIAYQPAPSLTVKELAA